MIWPQAKARAYLMHVAANLIEDETPFVDEIAELARAAQRTEACANETAFRRILADVLEWDLDIADEAVAEVVGGSLVEHWRHRQRRKS